MAVLRGAVLPAAALRKQSVASQPCLIQAFRCVILRGLCFMGKNALCKSGCSRFLSTCRGKEFFSIFIV